jgi:steroid delta-isomerase-like uncharacterized protein
MQAPLITDPLGSAPLADLLERYSAAWHAHDVDAIMALHTDDTIFHLHNGGAAAVGAEAVRQAFELVLALYPDLNARRVAVEIGASHAVAQSVMSATSAGRVVDVDAVDVFRIVDGLISRKDTYLDTAVLAG